jgi:predicted alpha/beta hydrolase family esterase
MKTACIVHGWDGSPDEPMLAWLRGRLVANGYEVAAPAMPEPAMPTIAAWVGKLQEVVRPSEETVLIGHSVGCQAVLRYLETLPAGVRVGQVVLIAPWMRLDEETIREEGEEVREIARPWMETPIDFAKVRSHAGACTAIFSDNDPFVPLSEQGLFREKLGATIVVEHGQGHFSPADAVSELPAALRAALTDG